MTADHEFIGGFEIDPCRPADCQVCERPRSEHTPGMARAKREYNRDFTPRTKERHYIMVDKIPAVLHDKVKAKAKREGVSLRALILRWLSEWIK